MKKLVIMSDNHGDQAVIEKIRQREKDADYYIHCGDSEASRKDVLNGFICVRGNNDWGIDLPDEARLEVEGYSILITHGHRLGYFNREYAMNDLLTRNHCQILISGHTHIPMFEQDGEFYYINPGSSRLPRGGSVKSYMIVYIESGHISYELKEI